MMVTQQLPQSGTCTLYPHLEGGLPRPGQPDHFLVTQLFHVLEQKCLPLLRHQLREGLMNLILRHGALHREGLFDQIRCGGGAMAGDVTSSPHRSRPATVDHDTEEPRPKALGTPAPVERTICSKEGILQRLLRIALIAEQVKSIAAKPEPIAHHEWLIGIPVALAHTLDQLGIRGAHLWKTRRDRHSSHVLVV